MILVGAVLLCFAYFLFGVVFGSFINVVAYRLPRGESTAYPPSSCPSCGKGIRWYENIPLLSWVLLDGKCSGCGSRIDLRYPVTEFVSGLLFATVACSSGSVFDPSAVLAAGAFLTLYAVSIIDIDHMEVYDSLGLLALVFALGSGYDPENPEWFVDTAKNALLTGGAFSLLRFLSGYAVTKKIEAELAREERRAPWLKYYHPKGFVVDAFGEGDVLVGFSIGALVGFKGALLSILAGSLYALLAIYAVLAVKGERMERAPFVPFLTAGALTVYFFPELFEKIVP